jgi:hypothetical protein
MSEQAQAPCAICHEAMFDSEFGPMCRGALASWRHVDDRWKRSFAGHPESNPNERAYLEKFGAPPGEQMTRPGS